MNIRLKQEKQKTLTTATTTITSFALLASVLVLSSFAPVQLASSNVYAQSTVPTVTATCGLSETGELDLTFRITVGEPSPTRYYYQLLDSSGTVRDIDPSGESVDPQSGFTYSYIGPLLGEEFTLNVYEDDDNDFPASGVEEEELVASDTVLCPAYTDLFLNEGQGIK
jgi:hypothetical protein